jgi:hypothetical protein
MTKAMHPTMRPPIAGSDPARDAEPAEERGHAVEALGVEQTNQSAEDADDSEPPQLHGAGELVVPDVAEEWTEPLEGPPHRVAHDGRNERGQQGFDLEVVAVQDLGGEYRASEGGPEDRTDARADPARDGDARVRGTEVEEPGEERAEPCADLAGRPLAPARASRANGERRGHDLHEDSAQPHATGVVVHRGDRRVGAVPLGLGRHGEDQHRSGQRAHARDERYGPRSREVRGRHCPALARGQRDLVPASTWRKKYVARRSAS